MAKKAAIIVRDRQHEALRMAVGLSLEDAAVSVYVMDNKLASDENIDLNVETVGDMDGKIYSNNLENKFDQMTTEEIALAIAEADAVIAY